MYYGRFFEKEEDEETYLKAEKEAIEVQKEYSRGENEELFEAIVTVFKSFNPFKK